MPSDGVSDGLALPERRRPDDRADAAGLPLPHLLHVREEPHPLHRPWWAGAAPRVLYTVAALFLFVLALEALKTGAGAVKPILSGVSADGPLNLLGFGWAGAYFVMSGSPVAAISLSLFAGGTISDIEAFAMINGSRLGASFIVLFVGFLLYVGHRRTADGLYIGVVALLTAFTLWLPVLPIGILVLRSGWLDGVQLSSPGPITSFVDTAYDPVLNLATDHLHRLPVFAGGIGILLASFTLFDRALPNLEQPSLRVERIREWVHHPLAMFVLGLLITAMTLSVSLSLTLLIPLSLKGYIRRDGIIPYVMGANISTWVDTLVAALLLNSPRAFTIVLTQMLVGALVSLAVLLLVYRPYSRAILGIATRITHSRRGFALFLGAIFLVPLALFFS